MSDANDAGAEAGTIAVTNPEEIAAVERNENGVIVRKTGRGPEIDREYAVADKCVMLRAALRHGDVLGESPISTVGHNKPTLASVLALLEGATDVERVYAIMGAASKSELAAELENRVTAAGLEGVDTAQSSAGPYLGVAIAIAEAVYGIDPAATAHTHKDEIVPTFTRKWQDKVRAFEP